MIDTTYENHREIKKKFSNLPFSCLAIDEGSINSKPILYFVFDSPGYTLPSYPCESLQMKGLKAKKCVYTIKKRFFSINLYNISIVSVVCDPNTAQKKHLVANGINHCTSIISKTLRKLFLFFAFFIVFKKLISICLNTLTISKRFPNH